MTTRELKLTLETAGGRTGIQWLNGDSPMVWDRQEPVAGYTGDDETVRAWFELYEAGEQTDSPYQIDGDDWRTLEDNGEKDYLWFWVKRGVALGTAVDACVEHCDPDGYDHEAEQALDEKDVEIETLKLRVAALEAELRKQIHGSRVVFDRELCDSLKVPQ